MSVDLDKKPFCLSASEIKWVKRTLASMSEAEKIGQLFCLGVDAMDDKKISLWTKKLKIGSLMIRPFSADVIQDKIRKLQESSEIPMLIAANLENGGIGAVQEGTLFANPMGCAATGDMINGYRLGKISCQEAAAAGINWGFAPVVDIDRNYHNPITNVRSFGNDADIVWNMAQGYLQAAKEEGIAAAVKHFPGDGYDERDQHLHVTVNGAAAEEWMDTYGKIYQKLIAGGVPSIMVGHIAQPAMAKEISKEISQEEAYMPASLSKVLLKGVLREKLGFNGLIVTDSTLMVGYMQKMPRRQAIPYSIECGADVLLFNRSIQEDLEYMRQGLSNGLVSRKRIDEAVMRILGLKVSLGTYKQFLAQSGKISA